MISVSPFAVGHPAESNVTLKQLILIKIKIKRTKSFLVCPFELVKEHERKKMACIDMHKK